MEITFYLSDSNYEKLHTIASLGKESMTISFKSEDESIDLNRIIPPNRDMRPVLTPRMLVRHFVETAINELLPGECLSPSALKWAD